MELSVGRFEDLWRGSSGEWSALVVGGFAADASLEKRLRRLGGEVSRHEDLTAAPEGQTGIAVIDCDTFGGVSVVEATLARLGAGLGALRGAILIGTDQPGQDFTRADDDTGPAVVRLRAPVSTLSLRMGLEFVLGRRLAGW